MLYTYSPRPSRMNRLPSNLQKYGEYPKVRGGKACIEGTRISVKDIVCLHEEGRTPEQMLNVFGTPLTLSQIHAALAYYYDHRDEIDASFAEEERIAAEYERKRAEYLSRRR